MSTKKTRLTVTPYVLQTVCIELDELRNDPLGRTTVEMILFKMGMLNVTRFADITHLSEVEVIGACVTKLLEINTFFLGCSDLVNNYLSGRGKSIQATDTALVARGELRLQKQIDLANLGRSAIITYMSHNLLGNTHSIRNIDATELATEIDTLNKKASYEDVNSLLTNINKGVKEIRHIIDEVEKLETNSQAKEIEKNVQEVKEELLLYRDRLLEEKSELNLSGLTELKGGIDDILSIVRERQTLELEVEERIVKSFGYCTDTVSEIRKISNNSLTNLMELGSKTERATKDFEDLVEDVIVNLEGIDKSTHKVAELQSKLDIDSLRASLLKLNQGSDLSKELTAKQAGVIEELNNIAIDISTKTNIVNDALGQLNSLVRKNTLLEMARTDRKVEDVSKKVESLGEQYVRYQKRTEEN